MSTESLRKLALAAKRLEILEERERQSQPGGLMAFVRYFWTILEPNQPFVQGWAIEAIAEHLEAVHFGQINRLLINVPPGFSKPACIEEPVITKRGVVCLKDIEVGDRVLTHKGRFRRVLAVHEQGVLPLVKITTEYGRIVRTALDHPFLTPRGWAQAQHLTGDDYCGVPLLEDGTKVLPHAASLIEHKPLCGIFTGPDYGCFRDKVITVEADGTGACRCLTVEEDASFTIGGLAVHNSLLTNCFFPAWEWSAMDRADHRYVSFSYAAHLTRRDNRKLINLLKSQRFAELWGKHRNLELVKEGEELVSNNRTGWKFATSTGGVGTGERGSRLLLDDAHNVKDTESDIVRNGIVRWFRESMSNRLNNMSDAIIVIMQRVHEDDVAGNIISDDEGLGYTLLRIPMEYIEDDPLGRPTKIGWTDPRTKAGELAWPERYAAQDLRQFKIIPYMWSAQYQQDPEPRGGAIILRDWWRLWEDPEAKRCPHCSSRETSKVQSQDPNSRWHSCDECGKHFLSRPENFPYCSYILASLDTSYTEKERNDPSAMTVWGIFQHPKTKEPGIILMNAWRKWLRMNAEPVERFLDENDFDFRERSKPKWGLVEWTVHTCRRFKADCLLIENRASGITLQQELQIQYGREMWTTIMKQPEGDKEARAHSVVGIFANKLVWAPEKDWATLMIDEAGKFPFGKYRDLTDSMTQALRHIRNLGLIQFEEERIAEEADGLRYKPKLQPLYPV